MNIFIFIVSYFFIILSVIGYGLAFGTSFYTDKKVINFGYTGLLGLFFLTIYSYISSFFFSHSLAHNSIVIGLGIFTFFFRLTKNYYFNKKKYLLLFAVFVILFISSVLYKNHEDFPYYHFPYTHLLNEFPAIFGLGAFNYGFRTPSSIFYINSLFYLPYIKYFSYHFTAIFVVGFSIIILIENIIKSYKQNNYNFITYLSLLSLIFISVIFYRIGAHGTDRSAQILIFVLIIDLLIISNSNQLQDYKQKFRQALIVLALIISFKAFFILYSIFFLYILIIVAKQINLLKMLEENIKYFFYFGLMILLVLLVNFQSSGCFLYPLKISCFTEFPWARSLEDVEHLRKWYEQWAKAGAGPNFRVDNADTYIQNFNWVQNWYEMYWKEKGINTTLGIIAISLVCIAFFYSRTLKKNILKKTYKGIFSIVLLLFAIWFYKHPALRYGGFTLLALIFFIPVSLYLDKFDHSKKSLKYKTILIIVITILVFTGRNINRISAEHKKYDYKPLENIFYAVNEKHYLRHNIEIRNLINTFEQCKELKNDKMCEDLNSRMGIYLDKYYYFK